MKASTRRRDFGGLAVRMATITGSRLGEVQQIAQSADCIKKLTNVGAKGATRWLLRLAPKGHKTSRADDTSTRTPKTFY